MNTNDPKAPYGEKRDPMLSDLQALEVAYPHVEYGGDCSFYGTDALLSIRDFYEAKITSGELMVVKTAKLADIVWRGNSDYTMPCCGRKNDRYDDGPPPEVDQFCKCGAKII